MMKVIRSQLNKDLSESKNDVQKLIDTLNYLRSKDPNFKFAYVLENESDDKDQPPKIDRMFI